MTKDKQKALDIWEKWIPFGFKNAPEEYYHSQKQKVIEEFALALEELRERCAKIVEESSLPDCYSEPALIGIAAEIRNAS